MTFWRAVELDCWRWWFGLTQRQRDVLKLAAVLLVWALLEVAL